MSQIVLALNVIKTVLLSGFLTTIVCCSQHVEILTNSVSARHWAKCPIFGLFAKFCGRRRRKEKKNMSQIVLTLNVIKTVLLSGFLTTIVCCSQHVEILTNSVSARHRAKCPIFGLFAKFGGRRHRPNCFSAKRYQNCSFDRII